MSSSEIVANRRFSGKKSFSLTCSRLSQYLKENGGFGDLNLGIACKPDVVTNGNIGMSSRQPTTTMSLFPCDSSMAAPTQQEARPMTLFPRQASFSSSSTSAPKEDALKTTHATTTRSVTQTAPLTIFYGGQVLVFNDFSAEKAKEVMNLASKGSANSFTGFTSNVNNNIQPVYVPNNIVKNQTEVMRSNNIPHLRKSATPEPIQPLATPLTCELPIARRASLHRFLEKRKDRVTSKAPYQLCDPAKASSKHQTGDSKTSWLGLAAEM